MAKTWKKVKVDGKDLIEVTDTSVVAYDRRRIEDEIRHLEMEISMAEAQKARAEAALAEKIEQRDTLPPEPKPAPIGEPIGPLGPA